MLSIANLVLGALAVIGGVSSMIQLRIWIRNWHNSRVDRFSAVERHGMGILRQIRHAGFSPDFVLGLGRSGAFLGGWLAGNLGSVPIEVIDRIHKANAADPMDFPYIRERLRLLKTAYGETPSVLIVEGATTRGGTFVHFEGLRQKLAPTWVVKYCVLYEVDTSSFHTDFVGKRLDRAPTRYPWHKTAEYKDFLRNTRSIDS